MRRSFSQCSIQVSRDIIRVAIEAAIAYEWKQASIISGVIFIYANDGGRKTQKKIQMQIQIFNEATVCGGLDKYKRR